MYLRALRYLSLCLLCVSNLVFMSTSVYASEREPMYDYC
jgi:hypothetical protein